MVPQTKLMHKKAQAATQKGYFLKPEGRGSQHGPDTATPVRQRSKSMHLMVGLLVILLSFISVTFYLITRDSRNQQAWNSHSTNVQVLSQQMAKSASEAAEGTFMAFFELGDA